MIIYSIKDILKEKKITQKELSLKTNISDQLISDMLTGKKDISDKSILKIEKALGLELLSLLKLKKEHENYLIRSKDEGINQISEWLTNLEEYKLYSKESIQKIASNMVRANKVSDRKREFESKSLGFRKYKDNPLAYLWVSLLEEKHGTKESKGSFKKSSGNTIIKGCLDILINKTKIENRLKALNKFLDKHGIVLINEPYLPNSLINAATFIRGKQRFIFMSDMKKREYQYIFNLIHELLHYYNNDFKDNDDYVAKVIKDYLNKYNKNHFELELAMKTFANQKEDAEKKWNSLYDSTNLRIDFGDYKNLIKDFEKSQSW